MITFMHEQFLQAGCWGRGKHGDVWIVSDPSGHPANAVTLIFTDGMVVLFLKN